MVYMIGVNGVHDWKNSLFIRKFQYFLHFLHEIVYNICGKETLEYSSEHSSRNMRTTYSFLLSNLLEQSDYSSVKSFYLSKENQLPVSYSTFSNYVNGNLVPTFERAKEILNTFDADMSAEDLTDVLDFSKRALKDIDRNEKYIQHGVRMNCEEFGTSKVMLERFLQMRSEELTGKTKSFNAYVCMLIKKDLEASGMLKGGEKI